MRQHLGQSLSKQVLPGPLQEGVVEEYSGTSGPARPCLHHMFPLESLELRLGTAQELSRSLRVLGMTVWVWPCLSGRHSPLHCPHGPRDFGCPASSSLGGLSAAPSGCPQGCTPWEVQPHCALGLGVSCSPLGWKPAAVRAVWTSPGAFLTPSQEAAGLCLPSHHGGTRVRGSAWPFTMAGLGWRARPGLSPWWDLGGGLGLAFHHGGTWVGGSACPLTVAELGRRLSTWCSPEV